MARAHNVYVVTLNDKPRKAFTVKHECRTWLKSNYPRAPGNLTIWRLPDGPWREEGPVNVTAEVYKFI